MGVEIDEARGHDESVGVDHFGRVVVVELPDFGDLTVLDADIALIARDPCSVDNGSALHDSVKLWHSYPPFLCTGNALVPGLLALARNVKLYEPKNKGRQDICPVARVNERSVPVGRLIVTLEPA